MKKFYWIAIVAVIGNLTGCNEFVTTSERTTSVDVVGEPLDPAPDSMKRADILGSALPLPDDDDLVTDSNAVSATPKPLPDDLDDPVDSEDKPDVAGGLGVAKPVSLKSRKADSSSSQ